MKHFVQTASSSSHEDVIVVECPHCERTSVVELEYQEIWSVFWEQCTDTKYCAYCGEELDWECLIMIPGRLSFWAYCAFLNRDWTRA